MDELPPLSSPGQRLGRYELLQRLAVGGMAELFLARATGPADFRKLVAVKRMLPQHALDLQLLRMFRDEARLMARLAHPNIPQVYDVSDRADVPFFVMEYVPGTDLRTVLGTVAAADEGAVMPLEQAIGVASAVAAGLHHAHEQRGEDGQPLGIVHRDVSPSNVLVSFDGAVKITDFGVAKWADQRSFTEHGQLKGKLAHMSPEQCRGEPLDRRSDLFALGTLIYELTTGRQPFTAESEYDLLSQIVSRDVPPPERPGGYPPELAAIVGRTLRRSRDDRYPTAQALQLDLEAFAREHKLTVSQVSLAGYLESLFGPRQASGWRAGHAGGRAVAEPPTTPGDPRAVSRQTEAPTRTATDVFADTASRRQAAEPPMVTGDGATALSAPAAVAPADAGAKTAGAAPTVSRVGAAPPPRAQARRRGVLVLATGGALAVLALGAVAWTASLRRPGAAPLAAPQAPPPATTTRATAAPTTITASPPPAGAGAEARATTGAPTEIEHRDPVPPPSSAASRPLRKRSTGGRTAAPRALAAEAAPSGATAATPIRAAAPAASGTAPSIRVWDPDSPVPP